MILKSLDFIYVPTRAADFERAIEYYTRDLGGKLVWKVRAMGTVVAQIELSQGDPSILLSEHLEGHVPVLIYRVDDYAATARALKARGVRGSELEIPHGPCFSFEAEGGQRLAVYELIRPEANTHFVGRIDE